MSEREYVPPFEPLAPEIVAGLVQFLERQSLIRGAYHVGSRAQPWPEAGIREEDTLWLDIAGRRRSRLARMALSAGVRDELQPVLLRGRVADPDPEKPRRSFGWNFVTRQTIREAGPAARVLWRAAEPPPTDLDPLAFELQWRTLIPPPAFADSARALLEQCQFMRRAWLTDEVLLKDGAEISSHAHLLLREQ